MIKMDMRNSAAMRDGRPSRRGYLLIAALVVLALAIIAGVVGGIPPLEIALMLVVFVLWAPVAAATAVIPFPLMIVIVVTVLVVAAAGVFVRHWRAMTWVVLAVNAPFVLWMAWVVTEYPRPCFEHVEVPVPGSDVVRLVPTNRTTPCLSSYWNTEGAHVLWVVFLWAPVLAVLGFTWFRTRTRSAARRPLPIPR